MRRLSNCPTLTRDRLRALLREYVDQTGHAVDLVLIGGMAMLAYGHPSRATIDVDGGAPRLQIRGAPLRRRTGLHAIRDTVLEMRFTRNMLLADGVTE